MGKPHSNTSFTVSAAGLETREAAQGDRREGSKGEGKGAETQGLRWPSPTMI